MRLWGGSEGDWRPNPAAFPCSPLRWYLCMRSHRGQKTVFNLHERVNCCRKISGVERELVVFAFLP